ncbi:MAG TPA: AsmA family protein [Xanthobacteraceae bacterium]|nr:AsmA family protein [Xanthobacteraceae bacterium]
MQTTLLGLAIAIILALVAALVAPAVVDWNHYRGAVEAEASRLSGLNVHVNGSIDGRLLPSPVITLHDVEAGEAGHQPRLRAGMLKVELALGPLLRGRMQASEVHLIAPEASLGFDPSGAVRLPAVSSSFDPEALSISQFSVEDGHLTLTSSSGSRLELQKLYFNGDIHSLLGPFSGEGAVVVADELYGYRISGSRADGDAIKIRLGVESSNHPLTTDWDGTLTFDHHVPQFDGTLAIARPAGATLANGQRVTSVPWRAEGSIKATPSSASLRNAAFRYGPDERALNFTGTADVTFGAHPHLDGVISAMQVDVDRALAAPDVTNRPPLVELRSFFQTFVAWAKLPVPAQIGLNIGAITIGGTSIESLRGDLQYDQTGWSLNKFQLHAPGMTDVTLSGRLTGTPQRFAFTGPAELGSADLDSLLVWLNGSTSARTSAGMKSLSAKGDVTIASDRVAVEQLMATLGQEKLEGQLAYNWPTDKHPARLDAQLRAGDLNLDALAAFANAAVGEDGFVLPQEAAIALDIGKATFAGIGAQGVNAQVKFDAGKLQIDRLSIGSLAGAKLDVSGRIDDLSSQPRGQVTLDLDARSLDGLGDIAAKFTPHAADALRRAADRLVPAKVHATLVVQRGSPSGSAAQLQISGNLAAMRLAANGAVTGEPSQLGAANVKLDARLDAPDGSALVALLGLDRVIGVDQLPGSLTVSAVGPLNGDVRVDSKISTSGFGSATQGTLRLTGNTIPWAKFKLQANAGDLRPLRQLMTGQPGTAVPVNASAALAIDGANLSFTDIAATVGKSPVRGAIAVGLDKSPISIDGNVEADAIDGASVLAMILGLPPNANGGSAPSSEKIGAGAFAAVNGGVTFKFARAVFTPMFVANGLAGTVHFHPSMIAFDEINGGLAGGRLIGTMAFSRDQDGVTAHGKIEVADAAAATVFGPSLNITDGQLGLNLQSDGFGASPQGLIGSLHGGGTLTLKNVQLAGLDPAAFDAAMQAAGTSGPIDVAKVQAAVSAALAKGHLTLSQTSAPIDITSGMLSLHNVTLAAQAESKLSLDGSLDLGNATISARMALSEPAPASALLAAPPELSVTIKGPFAAPQRMLDTTALMNWLTLRAAELQSRRIESIEASRHDSQLAAAVHPDVPDARTVPSGAIVESAVPQSLLAAPIPGARGLERLQQPPAPLGSPEPNGRGSESAAPTVPLPLPAPTAVRPRQPRTPAHTTRGAATATRPKSTAGGPLPIVPNFSRAD